DVSAAGGQERAGDEESGGLSSAVHGGGESRTAESDTWHRTAESDTWHRTAKVIELIGNSKESFEDAVQAALSDASQTIRHISGAEVVRMSVKCEEGRVLEYRVDLKVAFGIERDGVGNGR
ncbi:MAG TPA: dodecin family protein, partial [Candidatus Thermoplasmatota archaeon]|nr:dodecin family protein [Candidatus Thermoplasmatota archaeon]